MARPDPTLLLRAARLSHLPGVTLAETCARTGVSRGALRRARELHGLAAHPSREDLALSALTKAGAQAEGELGDLAGLASFLDHVNHDGTTEAEVRDLLRALEARGLLALEGPRWRLLAPWP